jgi:hypothetical protein
VAAVASSDLQKRPVRTPDPHDEPSVEWGWHGTLPTGALIGGVFIVILVFAMFIGNHIGHVEDIYLTLTGIGMIVVLLLSMRRRRKAWRR